MQVQFVNPFLSSLMNVLSTMADIQTKPGRPQLKHDCKSRGEVTGMIAMQGQQATGSLSISFEQSAIFYIAKKMLKEDFNTMNCVIADLVGEITNMVSGGAKRVLGDSGYAFDMTQPSVIVGEEHTINHSTHGHNIMVSFKTPEGNLYVEMCF